MSTESDTEPDADAISRAVESSVRERFAAMEPGPEEKRRLLRRHRNHLLRKTTSQLTVDDDHEELEGVESNTRIFVPDRYCFTCGEWVGLSGVDLQGEPRSRSDADWLDGPPDAVDDAQDALLRLADHLATELDHLDGGVDALDLLRGEAERLRGLVE